MFLTSSYRRVGLDFVRITLLFFSYGSVNYCALTRYMKFIFLVSNAGVVAIS
jgi:hypothetical protein